MRLGSGEGRWLCSSKHSTRAEGAARRHTQPPAHSCSEPGTLQSSPQPECNQPAARLKVLPLAARAVANGVADLRRGLALRAELPGAAAAPQGLHCAFQGGWRAAAGQAGDGRALAARATRTRPAGPGAIAAHLSVGSIMPTWGVPAAVPAKRRAGPSRQPLAASLTMRLSAALSSFISMSSSVMFLVGAA